MARIERRRQRPSMRHALSVHLAGNASQGMHLEVRCECGMVVGGRRFYDRQYVSLTDLLELVRLHRKQLGET